VCRKNYLHGWCIIAFGVGLMVGHCLESWMLCSVGGFVLVMAGLTVGGMLFNGLNDKFGGICVSWLVHMCANFAINTIGFILL
jgi:hypothetical protein